MTTLPHRSHGLAKITCSTALAAMLATAAAAPVGAQQRPNVVYILLDDAGWGDLGCYGQQKIREAEEV